MVVLLPCLWYMFSFKCHQLYSLVHCSRSWIPLFWRIGTFFWCLLQKIKKAFSLPFREQWEEYVILTHSRFAKIVEKDFHSGNCLMIALNEVESQFFQTDFRVWCPLLLRGIFELFTSHPCFKTTHRTGHELLLPCNCGWWRWRLPFPDFNKL